MAQPYHNQSDSARFSVAILGAGRIGALWDTPESANILTHAHAFSLHPRTALSGFVETDSARGAQAARLWGAKCFPSLEALYAKGNPDIVVVATPDATHVSMLEAVIVRGPKLIICEKPLATTREDLASAKKIQTEVPIIVNYSRRFDRTVQDVARRLAEGEFGEVLSGTGMYTNGLLHNGAHLIDLTRLFFGEVTASTPLRAFVDNARNDVSITAHLVFERCPEFYLGCGDERHYSVFELDIYTAQKHIRFSNFGFDLTMWDKIPHPVYPTYSALSAATVASTGLSQALPVLVDHALAVLDTKESSSSSLENALRTEETCFQLLQN